MRDLTGDFGFADARGTCKHPAHGLTTRKYSASIPAQQGNCTSTHQFLTFDPGERFGQSLFVESTRNRIRTVHAFRGLLDHRSGEWQRIP